MKNYLTFEQAINRDKYGTNIHVTEAYTGKDVFSGTHNPRGKWVRGKKKYGPDVLEADVTQFTVENGALCIEIVKQEAHNG